MFTLCLGLIVVFYIPLNLIDITNDENSIYVLLCVFMICLGQGGAVNLEFATGALIFPALFMACAFSVSNIAAPASSIFSS
jgi:hypothetical protein